MGPDVIAGGRVPVLSWSADLEEGARRQAVNCANLGPAHHHVAVMADGHQGYGVPIGAVLALRDAVSPYAVGNDIGCGMAIVPTRVSRADVLPARDDLMGWVKHAIPAGRGVRQQGVRNADIDGLLSKAWDALVEASSVSGIPLSTTQSTDPSKGQPLSRDVFVQRGRLQAGTLGSGNHFIELVVGPDEDVWVMLHSGSRGAGALICNNFHRMALAACAEAGQALPDPGLAWLPLSGGGRWERVGRCYERALRAGLSYAELNRQVMLEDVASEIERRFPRAMDWGGMVNIHHNDATPERHFGAEVWVHRKGAVKASKGTMAIIPGSMATGSVLGRGRGDPESFTSCSHGAGRALSRGRARDTLSLDDQMRLVHDAGGEVFADSKEGLLDEMPGAYKDLDVVMAQQADLVEPVRRFSSFATYKGADPPRRRKAKRGWRPDEEK